MTTVHILPPEIISKIAAGEVIERPASVVKELLENSLDANASSIEVHLKEAGKTLIHIKDNGHGIEQNDLEKIFLRHATSKIKNLDDLFAIRSLGFRGEALYSVAAIADITLRSRTPESENGWEIHMRGGKKLDFRPASMPVGTEIEIKELFFNTPARKKFLKTNTTEIHQILNMFIPYTLQHKDCRFLLTHQSKILLDLKPEENMISRAADTLNLNKDHILEVQHNFPDKNIAIHMLLGDINIVRSRRDMQFMFINGRPVQNKNLSFHMNNVYRLILPPNQYPFFVLIIQFPVQDIDVNIHPTKREVKIKGEQNLCTLLRHICEQTLMSAGGAKQAKEPSETSTQSEINHALSKNYSSEKILNEPLAAELFEPSTPYEKKSPTEQYSFPQERQYSMAGETFLARQKDSLHNKLNNARYVGYFMNKFLLFEYEKSLLLIDQHAAAERVTFEQLIGQMEKGSVEAQNLLSPDLIPLSPQELLIWEEAKDALESAGFTSTQFDETTIAIHSYPVLLKNPKKAVQDILAGEKPSRTDHETLARRACRSSIMAGDPLHKKEAEHLRQKLLDCLAPFTCPHGRPTIIEMTEDFLNKQFLRSQ